MYSENSSNAFRRLRRRGWRAEIRAAPPRTFQTAKEPVMPEADPPLAEKQIGLNHILEGQKNFFHTMILSLRKSPIVIGIVANVIVIGTITYFLFATNFLKPITDETLPQLSNNTVDNSGGRTAPDALDACLDSAIRILGKYDESAPEVHRCYDLWFKDRAFHVTIFTGGAFPCYDTATTTIEYNGAVTVARKKTNPYCLSPDEPEQQTQTFQLTPDELTKIRAAVQSTDVFSFDDRYVNPNLLDYTGSQWTFIINGKEKKIDMQVGHVDDLPNNLAEVVTTINQILSIFSGL